MSLVDGSRPEVFTSDPDDRRDLAVQVWYPAVPAPGAKPEPFWEDAGVMGPRLAAGLGMPRFLFDHLSLVRSHSYPNAPLMDRRVRNAARRPVSARYRDPLRRITSNPRSPKARSTDGFISATLVPMKYVSIRELRNRPGRVWSTLSKEDVVLTANGKPMGVLVGVDETRLDDTVEAIRRAKAVLAVSRIRRKAAQTGTDRISMEEINREIRGVRARRRPA